MPENRAHAGTPPQLYARAWRWHFFAALIVIPFVLWQSITGTIYLWHRDLSAWLHPELLRVAPAGDLVSYERQLATALEHAPLDRLQAIELSDDPARATIFYFRDDNGLVRPVFVDPHTGEYLGSLTSTRWIRGLSRALHGGWPVNPFGSYLLELGASWAVVMTLTGLYLWWPRGARGFGGILYPRLRAGMRTFWRDLHAVAGVYLALFLLAFLLSALPWTTLWGGKILASIQRATGQTSPAAFFFAAGADPHHGAGPDPLAHDGHASGAAPARDLDTWIASARAAGAHGVIELHPRFDGTPINARDDHPRGRDEVWLQLDAHSGAVLTKVVWQDFPLLPRLVTFGIDLHEGGYLGRINQVFNTLFAAGLVWMCVTGFIGWYRRRPGGGLAPPPRRPLRYPRAVIAVGATLCVVLPLLGVSVLAIATLDRAFGWMLPGNAR